MVFRDSPTYWTSPLLPDGELLTATFHAQRFNVHWHETYVIPIIQAGAQSYWYRGARHVAVAGTIAAINPGEAHSGERAVEGGWAYRAFYPTLAWVQALGQAVTDRKGCVPSFPDTVIADPDVAVRLLRAHVLLEVGRDALEAETALHGGFAALLVRHSRSRRRPRALCLDPGRIVEMQERLSSDLTEPITLAELAAGVGLSPFYAARLFCRAVGMPPHAWRNQLRINRALVLLRRGVSVAGTAAAIGFSDQSHFTRHFKRAYGVPPGRWATASSTRKNVQAR